MAGSRRRTYTTLGYAHCNGVYARTIAIKETTGARSLSFSSSTRSSDWSSCDRTRQQTALDKNCNGILTEKLQSPSLIQSVQILPDIPHPSTEQGLSQLRSPMRTDPGGPTRSTTLPAHLSPPATKRPQLSTDYQNGTNRNSSYSLEDRSPKRSSFEKAPTSHQLPIHSGPPHSRSSYSPSTSGPAPVSPYASQAENRRAYPTTVPNSRVRTPDQLSYSGGSGLSTSLPPPPMPYRNGVNGHAPYKAERDYDSAGYGDAYYENSRNRTVPS